MKHPLLDCSVPIDEGIEAYREKLESDLEELKMQLTMCIMRGIDHFPVEHIAELAVDIEIIQNYLKK